MKLINYEVKNENGHEFINDPYKSILSKKRKKYSISKKGILINFDNSKLKNVLSLILFILVYLFFLEHLEFF